MYLLELCPGHPGLTRMSVKSVLDISISFTSFGVPEAPCASIDKIRHNYVADSTYALIYIVTFWPLPLAQLGCRSSRSISRL